MDLRGFAPSTISSIATSHLPAKQTSNCVRGEDVVSKIKCKNLLTHEANN